MFGGVHYKGIVLKRRSRRAPSKIEDEKKKIPRARSKNEGRRGKQIPQRPVEERRKKEIPLYFCKIIAPEKLNIDRQFLHKLTIDRQFLHNFWTWQFLHSRLFQSAKYLGRFTAHARRHPRPGPGGIHGPGQEASTARARGHPHAGRNT